jgi:hypothetical protein
MFMEGFIMLDRILELLELAAVQGFILPMPPERIIELEDDGHVVDLVNGEIIIDGASDWFELTVAGEAIVHIWDRLEVA